MLLVSLVVCANLTPFTRVKRWLSLTIRASQGRAPSPPSRKADHMDRPLPHLVTSISNAPALGYDELFSRLSVLFFLKALELSVAILLVLDTKALVRHPICCDLS